MTQRDSHGRRGDRGTREPTTANPQAWHELLDAVSEFRKLAPWGWMNDSQVFGVYDAQRLVDCYCCVIGALGEMRGLSVFEGDEGWQSYAGAQDGTADALDGPFSMHALRVAFCDRTDLDPAGYRLLRALGRRYRGRGAWPEVTNVRPGYWPILASDEEAAGLVQVVREAIHVCSRVRDEPKLLDGKLLVRRDGRDTRRPRPPRREPAPMAGPDRETIRRVAELTLTDDVWLGDHFYMPAVIDEGERPFFPRQLVWLDGQSGVILDAAFGGPGSGAPELRERFVQLAEEHGLPRAVVVRRSDVRQALSGLDHRLEVVQASDTEPFLAIREMFENFLDGGTPA